MKSLEWGGKSALDAMFLGLVKNWIEQDGEVYVMYYFPKTGGKTNHYLFNSYDRFLSTLTSPVFAGAHFAVDVYRHPQFPVRGWVDSEFVNRALLEIQDEKDWFLIAFDEEIGKGQPIGAYGDSSHKTLIEELNDYLDKYVVIGPDIHWSVPPDDYPGEWISADMDEREAKSA